MRQHQEDSTPSARGDTFSTCRMGVATRSRSGFTLVELLVVIGIIGTVMALAVPTIFSAVASARNAKTKAELDMLHIALMNYKNEYGSLPPAYMGPVIISGQTIYLWNGGASPPQVNTQHPVYKHLARVFPRLAESKTDPIYLELSQLSPAQALVFWLSGFYDNLEYPLTNGGVAGTRRKLFDFDQSRLYATLNDLSNPYTHYTVQTFSQAAAPQSFRPLSAGNDFQRKYPVYFTGHPSCGLPYVYFDSRSYATDWQNDTVYPAQSMNGDASAASPYIASLPPVNPTWAQQHANPDTFQLIAAGRDGLYGSTQAAFPGDAGAPPPPTGYWSAGNIKNAIGHPDNITNFADRALGDAIESLQSE